MRVRRADCGHFVRVSTKPSAISDFGLVVLCDVCRAALKRPKIERKA